MTEETKVGKRGEPGRPNMWGGGLNRDEDEAKQKGTGEIGSARQNRECKREKIKSTLSWQGASVDRSLKEKTPLYIQQLRRMESCGTRASAGSPIVTVGTKTLWLSWKGDKLSPQKERTTFAK